MRHIYTLTLSQHDYNGKEMIGETEINNVTKQLILSGISYCM